MADVASTVDKELVAKSYGVDPQGEPDAFRFLSRALDFPLPEPWTLHADKKGRIFYWNPAVRQSSWAHPLASTHESLIHAFRHIKEAGLVANDPAVPENESREALVLAEIEEFHKQGEQEIALWRVSHAPDGATYYYKAGTQETRWDNPREELQRHQELRVRMFSELLEAEVGEKSEAENPDITHIPEEESVIMKAFETAKALQDKHMVLLQVRNEENSPKESQLDQSLPPKVEIEPQRLQGEFDAAGSPICRPDGEIAGRDAPPAPVSAPTVEESNPRQRLAEAGQRMLDDGTDVPWIDPEELAFNLGLRLDEETDKASFHILKPLFALHLPVPWRGLRHQTGRADFYHPGTGESRQVHPMFSFFQELVVFLRGQAATEDAMSKPLSAQVSREVSPQSIRERLGVWEGPFEVVPGARGGAISYDRSLPGTDSACVIESSRRDDPRTEAVGNLTARLDGWYHLWQGFCPEEPFPLEENGIASLVAQLSEAVVIEPGDHPDEESVLRQWNSELERRSQAVSGMNVPLTAAEEEKVQCEVTGILGAAYGVAVERASSHEALLAEDPYIHAGIDQSVSTVSSSFDAKPLDSEAMAIQCEKVKEEDDDEDPLSPYGDEKDAFDAEEDDFDEESLDDDLDEKFKLEANVDDGPSEAVETAAQQETEAIAGNVESQPEVEDDGGPSGAVAEPSSADLELLQTLVETTAQHDIPKESQPEEEEKKEVDRGPSDNVEPAAQRERAKESLPEGEGARGLPDDAVEAGAQPEIEVERGSPDAVETEAQQEMEEEPVEVAAEEEPVEPFLFSGEPAVQWAEHAMRPLTPPRTPSRQATLMPTHRLRAPPAALMNRPKPFDKEIWANQNFLKHAVIKPYVSNLGWRCHHEIARAMWAESDAEPESTSPEDPPSPSTRRFRSIGLPAANALDQVREAAAAEVDSFRDSLKASDSNFDKCLSGHPPKKGERPSTPLVQPHLDRERSKPMVHDRKPLLRLDIPNHAVLNRNSTASDAPREGCVPAPPSPANQIRSGVPEPPYLQGQLTKHRWGSSGVGRARSTDRTPCVDRDTRMRAAVRVRSADARARKPGACLVPQGPDLGAKVASEKLKPFLSRKCGRIETAFEQFDQAGRGFITMAEWLDGLNRLEYDQMEYAQQVFKLLDTRQHHVLTLSDLVGRRTQSIYDGLKDDDMLEEELSGLLSEVLGEEVAFAVKEAMQATLLAALRAPQPSITELPDVGAWLRTRPKSTEGKAKFRALGRDEAEQQRSRQLSPQASETGDLEAESPSQTLPIAGKKKKSKAQMKMPKPAGAESSSEGESTPKESQPGRSASSSSSKPSARASLLGQKKKVTRASSGAKSGVLSMMLGNEDENTTALGESSEAQAPPAATDKPAAPGSRESTKEEKRGSAESALGAAEGGQAVPERSLRSRESTKEEKRGEGDGADRRRRSLPDPAATKGKQAVPKAKRASGQTNRPSSREATVPGDATSGPTSESLAVDWGGIFSEAGAALSPVYSGRESEESRPPSPVHEADFKVFSQQSTSPPAPKPRQVRVVQIGRRGPSGQMNQSAPQLRPVQSGGSRPSSDPSHARSRPGMRPAPQAKGYPGPSPQQMAGGDAMPQAFEPDATESPHSDEQQFSLFAAPQQKRGFPEKAIRPEGAGHNFFDVGFHSPAQKLRRPERLLPYVPQGPERVCKTYSHIFKLLNDPGLKKHMEGPRKGPPKQKQSIHVSMPRLPAAGGAIIGGNTSFDSEYPSAVDEDEAGAFSKKMLSSSQSLPSLVSTGGSGANADPATAWQSTSMQQRDVDSGGLQLPRLSKSAP